MRNKRLSNTEISSFCEQIAMILNAGISLYEGISIMVEDAEDNAHKEMLTIMKDKLEMGEKFFDAVQETKVFPVYVVHMMKIGEESGRLDEVSKSLADYYEREEGIRKAIKNAITYPLIMIVIMIIVIIALLVKVLPIFEEVFIMLGTQMSGVSKSLMNMGDIFETYAIVFVIIIAVIAALFLYFTQSENGKLRFKHIASHFGPMRNMYERVSAGRFASGMALTLKSGLDVNESVEMVSEMIELPLMKEKTEKCLEYMSEGESFADSLSKSKVFSNMYSRMVVIGFKTGAVDNVMEKIADNYKEETDTSIDQVISVLEPTLVAVFSVIVGLILMSVMLPLLSIMTGLM